MSVLFLGSSGLGFVLILAGLVLTIVEERRKPPPAEVRATAAGIDFDALAEFVEALARHPVGIRLIVLGIVLLLIGAAAGGIAAVTDCVCT